MQRKWFSRLTPDPAGAVPEPAWPKGPDIPGQHPRSVRLDLSVPGNVVGPELPGNLTLEGRRTCRAGHTTPQLSLLEAHEVQGPAGSCGCPWSHILPCHPPSPASSHSVSCTYWESKARLCCLVERLLGRNSSLMILPCTGTGWTEDLWLPHPCKRSRKGWIRLGATSSSGGCPCCW